VKNLVKAEKMGEAIDVASEHGLFHELLSIVDPSDSIRKEILEQYGWWLKSKGMQEDAGAAFLAAEKYKEALDTYESVY